MSDRKEYSKKYYEMHKKEIAIKQDERHKLLDSKKPHKMLQHHVKYEEIHGVDEIVLLTYREHKKLHNRLRREGKCNIPAEELSRIVRKAADRSPNKKERNKINHSSDRAKEYNSNYHKQNEQIICFPETLAPYIILHDNLIYNNITGNVRWVSYFIVDKRNKEKEQVISFNEALAPYIMLYEKLVYNKITGNVRWVSNFKVDKRPPLISSSGWDRANEQASGVKING